MALELAAAIAGLIALADIAVIKASKYYSLHKNAVPEIQGLLKETINLAGALYSLEKSVNLFNSLRDSDEEDDRRLNSLVYIEDCRKCLFELEKILDKISPQEVSKWEKIKSSLRWPLSASETREFAQKVQRLKSTISVGLEADSLEALCKLLSGQKSVQESIGRVEKEQQRIARAKQQKELDRDILHKLDSLSTYGARKHAQMVQTRHPGTSIWFRDCEEYTSWLQKPNSALWFDGIPGAGKSVLTSAIIEDLRLLQTDNIALAYFYIEYSSDESQKFCTLAGSLLRQLAEQYPTQLMSNFWSHVGQQFTNSETATVDSVLKSMRDITQNFSTTMLVIDGLDECDKTGDRRQILEFTSLLGQSAQGSIKVIATSRSHVDIKNSLRDFANISIAATSTDIKLFVAAELENRLRSEIEFYGIRIQDPELKAEIVSTLVQKSNGMFQWVRAQLDTISRISGDTNKRNALENLPEDLPETYRRIMLRVDERNRGLVRTSMLFLYSNHYYNHLSLETLTDVVAHEIRDCGITERDILLSCSSLIKQLSSSIIEFAHFSVWEFITSVGEMEEWYYISEDLAHEFEKKLGLKAFAYFESCLWYDNSAGKQCRILNGLHPARIWNLDAISGSDKKVMEALRLNLNLPKEHQSRINLAFNVFGMIHDILSEYSPFFRTITVSFEDIVGSEFIIACFLRPDKTDITEWCIEQQRYDPSYRIMGGITAAHVIFARLLCADSEILDFVDDSSVDNTLRQLTTPETVDYQFLFLLREKQELWDKFLEDGGTDEISLPAKESFRGWVVSQIASAAKEGIPPSDALGQVHTYICQQLQYQFQSDLKDPPGWILEAFEGFIDDESYQRTFWKAVLYCRDLFPDSGSKQLRKWFEIIAQGPGFKRLLSKLNLQEKPNEAIISLYSVCHLSIKTQEFELLRRLIVGNELGTALDPTERLDLLNHLLLSNTPSDDQKTVIKVTYGHRLGFAYFKSVFSLVEKCRVDGLLSDTIEHIVYTRLHEYLRQYIHPFLDYIEKAGDKYTMSLNLFSKVVAIIGSLESNDFIDMLSSLSGLDAMIFLDFTELPLDAHLAVKIPTWEREESHWDFLDDLKFELTRMGDGSNPAEVLPGSAPGGNCNMHQEHESSESDYGSTEDNIDRMEISSEPDTEMELIISGHYPDNIYSTPLGNSIQDGRDDELRQLLRGNADRFYVDSGGKTYFHLLVEKGDTRMLQIFLEEPIWWMDELRNRHEPEKIVQPLPPISEIIPTSYDLPTVGNPNIQFCLDVFAKGLAAMQQTSDPAEKYCMGDVITQLNQLAFS